MLLRLLDTLLPATVLVALVFAMATGFGAFAERPVQRVVQLPKVVVHAAREQAHAQTDRAASAQPATALR